MRGMIRSLLTGVAVLLAATAIAAFVRAADLDEPR
jgi:hypothetical protein